MPEKVFASLDEVKHYHAKGNPLLIFTGSVEMSEIYSSLLLREGIAHNLLNANNVAREAQMIAESGQLGAVTVATSMAGRGTDIKLGPGVADLGGLVVIGTERMENHRIDPVSYTHLDVYKRQISRRLGMAESLTRPLSESSRFYRPS